MGGSAEEVEVSRGLKRSVLVAALTLVVLVTGGGGAASATQLCKTTDCSEVYEAGQALEASLVEATTSTFETVGGTIVCAESAAKGETTAKSGEPLPAKISSLTFGGCGLGEANCTVTAVNLPYNASFKETGEGNGTMTISSGGSGNPGVQAACELGITCTATAEQLQFAVTGGNPAIASIEKATLQLNGVGCPPTAQWTSKYAFAVPQPMRVGPRPTVLCKVAPNEKGVCPKGEQYIGKVNGAISAGVAKLEKSVTEYISCGKATFEGDYNKAASGSVEKFSFEGKTEEECESTLPNKPKVKVTFKGLPYAPSWFEYKVVPGVYQGVIWFGTQASMKLEAVIEAVTCKYNLNVAMTMGLVANGGAGATIASLSGQFVRETINVKCPVTLAMTVVLALTRGKDNVYIAKEVAA
jgi:hypothetical protein